jgi:hypothetical protein
MYLVFFKHCHHCFFSTNTCTTACQLMDGRLEVQSQPVVFQGVDLRGSAANTAFKWRFDREEEGS